MRDMLNIYRMIKKAMEVSVNSYQSCENKTKWRHLIL